MNYFPKKNSKKYIRRSIPPRRVSGQWVRESEILEEAYIIKKKSELLFTLP